MRRWLLNTLHEGTRDLGGARISRIALRVGSWNRKHSHKLVCNRHLTNTGVGVENDKGHCFAVNDCVMDQECMGWLPGKLGDSVMVVSQERRETITCPTNTHTHVNGTLPLSGTSFTSAPERGITTPSFSPEPVLSSSSPP
jgi:hypothetical protein